MKLQNVKYEDTDKWYTSEYIPDNPRSVLLFTEEGGTAEGKYERDKWIQYRWNCEVHPKFWREMPRWKQQ